MEGELNEDNKLEGEPNTESKGLKGLKALKRAVMKELYILMGIFSAFIQGVDERFHGLL